MTWQQTHARWQALREIETALATDPLIPPVWHRGYDDLFGDRAGLTTFLRYRWRLRLDDADLDDLRASGEHPARTVARVGLAALDLQDAVRAAA